MYIGGSSGSTAGGLKTSTFGVLVIHALSIFKGKEETQFLGRTINIKTVNRSFVLLFTTMSIITTAIVLLSITETLPENVGIEYIIFEVFSAFGTVGVTLGLTSELTAIGKFLVMGLMFIGRVGIFTILLSLIKKDTTYTGKIRYPEETTIIG